MDNFNIAQLLRQFREQNGYSVREMADILIMSKSAYDRLERGLTKPGYDEIKRILKILQVNPDTYREIDTRGKPVGTIAYLKRGLLYGSISTDVALSCFADLAEAIGDADMLEWAILESKGYHDSDKFILPAYRSVASIYEMECEQDGRKFFLTLPSELIYGEEHRTDSVLATSIERLEEESPKCRRKFSGLHEGSKNNLESALREIYGPNLSLIRAVAFIPVEFTQKILLAVQEIILHFLFEVEIVIGSNASLSDLRAQKYLVGKLFQKVQATVGSADHLELPVKPSLPKTMYIVKGDEDSFCDWLEANHIGFYEEDEFFVIREGFEQTPPPAGIVPPEMCAWAEKVTSANAHFRENEGMLLNGLREFYGVEG